MTSMGRELRALGKPVPALAQVAENLLERLRNQLVRRDILRD
jgi:hypothetical protein